MEEVEGIKWILTNPKWLGKYKDTDAQFESVFA